MSEKKNALQTIPPTNYLEVEQRALEAKLGQQSSENGPLLLSVWSFVRQDFRSTVASWLVYGGAAASLLSILAILGGLYFGLGLVPELIIALALSMMGVAGGHRVERRARRRLKGHQLLLAKARFPRAVPEYLFTEIRNERVLLSGEGSQLYAIRSLAWSTLKPLINLKGKLEARCKPGQEPVPHHIAQALVETKQLVALRRDDMGKLLRRRNEIRRILDDCRVRTQALYKSYEDLEITRECAGFSEESVRALPEIEGDILYKAQEISDFLKQLRGMLEACYRESNIEALLVGEKYGSVPEFTELSDAIDSYVMPGLPELPESE